VARADFADVAGIVQNARVAGEADDADSLDGLDSTQLGINRYKFVRAETTFDSSTSERLLAFCPSGPQIIGGGGDAFVGTSDPDRDAAPIAVRTNGLDHWNVEAVEVAPYGFNRKV
jgi:hypothetical protein